jgi:hypothetical protein
MTMPPKSQPAELLFEFLLRGHERFRCELREHGPYGVEALFLRNEEFEIGHTFHQRLDANRTPREMAIAWAHEWRAWVETGGTRASPRLKVAVPQMPEQAEPYIHTRQDGARQATGRAR